MADENGIVVKPAIVKQDGNTTEIEIHIEKPRRAGAGADRGGGGRTGQAA